MLLRRINLPSIILSYHSFLHFSVNFLSHSQLAVFDIKIARKQVLVSILSHNLSHELPRQPPLFLITRAFFCSGGAKAEQCELDLKRAISQHLLC